MATTTSTTWMTKYGSRKVRYDPATLAEAIVAAQGLTDDLAGQIEIAADLTGADVAEVKAEMAKLAPDRRETRYVAASSRDGARTVVVERKASRRIIARDAASTGLDRSASRVTLTPRAR